MKKRKRTILIVIGVLVFILFNIGFVMISSKKELKDSLGENEIMHSYNVKKENSELLEALVTEVVSENGIEINQIPTDKYGYRIYDENENIVFYYYLKEYSESNPPNATIVLTKQYKVLEQNYSIKLESFEEFKDDYIGQTKIISVIKGIMNLILFYLGLAIILLIGEFIFVVFNIIYEEYQKSQKSSNNNLSGGKKNE